ncbi:MAG: serine hydrolase domain-containing protein [Acidimicrobiales bacterium]
MDTWPVTAAAGVTAADETLATAGDPQAPRKWASVTKLLTALAVLVATEEGTVDLDDPAGPPGATVRHLLAHASGLAPDSDDVMGPPGTRRRYSNRGIEVAAAHTETQSGVPFATYLREAVIEPLGLSHTTLDGSPASGAMGPLTDLLTLGRELLAPTVITPATLRAATRTAFPDLDGVLPGYGRQSPNDWGLGFELRHHKDPHWTGQRNSPATFGHFGLSGAFLWVDPELGLACAELADTDFGPWAINAWPALSDAVIESYTLRR